MLIYNYKKEFLGIDEADLKALGVKDLAELHSESADFADLFVKTPGYISNFKHVHWIDYVISAEGVDPKVIIHIKNKNYSANIDIKPVYLVDNPSSRAYIVNLSNLRSISASMHENISADLAQREAPKTATGATRLSTIPSSVVHDENVSVSDEKISDVSYDPYESEVSNTQAVEDIYDTTPHYIEEPVVNETPISLNLEDTLITEPEPEPKPEPEPEVKKHIEVSKGVDEGEFAGYVYDPHFAAEELGFTVDLVQEFIEDFIAQAESFKSDLYEALQNANMDTLRIQSHKLKGVAANLRIEDALDALTTINASEDYHVIKTNLDKLYKSIKKLSNSPTPVSSPSVNEKIEEIEDEDEFVLSIKNDFPETKIGEIEGPILDSDVPDNISIPELADDDFLNSELIETQESIDDEELSIIDSEVVADPRSVQEEALDIAFSYDKELIASDIGLDIDSFNELFHEYIDEAKELSETIIKSANESKLSVCKSSAIKLKGMSENMRIHKFDSELENIINATNTDIVNSSITGIKLKLDQISKIED